MTVNQSLFRGTSRVEMQSRDKRKSKLKALNPPLRKKGVVPQKSCAASEASIYVISFHIK
jgi:hypothetical protein